MGGNMTNKIKQAERIVQAYGKVLELVINEWFTKYPSQFYPTSLLPYSKKKITGALLIALIFAKAEKDIEYINSLKYGLFQLQSFVPDEEAHNRNRMLLDKLIKIKEWPPKMESNTIKLS
jgi:hypothetical protein